MCLDLPFTHMSDAGVWLEELLVHEGPEALAVGLAAEQMVHVLG
jgi:hypothetical protein